MGWFTFSGVSALATIGTNDTQTIVVFRTLPTIYDGAVCNFNLELLLLTTNCFVYTFYLIIIEIKEI